MFHWGIGSGSGNWGSSMDSGTPIISACRVAKWISQFIYYILCIIYHILYIIYHNIKLYNHLNIFENFWTFSTFLLSAWSLLWTAVNRCWVLLRGWGVNCWPGWGLTEKKPKTSGLWQFFRALSSSSSSAWECSHWGYTASDKQAWPTQSMAKKKHKQT